MKKLLTTVIWLILLLTMLSSSSVFAEEKQIRIFINGEVEAFSIKPINVNGSVLVPMRAIFERFDAEVSWDNAKKQVTAVKGKTTIVLTVQSKTAYINESPVELNTEPQIVNGSTMVPLRIVGEALGSTVSWDSAEYAVRIDTSPTSEESEDEDTSTVEPATNQPTATYQAAKTDEEQIRELIQSSIDGFNQEDAEKFIGSFEKAYETVAQLQDYFLKNDSRVELVSVSDIQVNGTTATAQIVRYTRLYDNYGTDTQYIYSETKDYILASFVKKDSGWLISKFTFNKSERTSSEDLAERINKNP